MVQPVCNTPIQQTSKSLSNDLSDKISMMAKMKSFSQCLITSYIGTTNPRCKDLNLNEVIQRIEKLNEILSFYTTSKELIRDIRPYYQAAQERMCDLIIAWDFLMSFIWELAPTKFIDRNDIKINRAIRLRDVFTKLFVHELNEKKFHCCNGWLAAGADINSALIQDPYFFDRIKFNYLDQLKYLINHGANFNFCDRNGITPLMIAVQYDLKEVFSLLIQTNINVNFHNHNGTTPLMIATFGLNFSFALDLIKKGANINACDNYHQTALIHAIISGENSQEKNYNRVKLVQLFIENKADMFIEDRNGHDAVYYAKQLKFTDIYRVLENYYQKNFNRSLDDCPRKMHWDNTVYIIDNEGLICEESLWHTPKPIHLGSQY
jgi:hypothetical protein